MAQFTNQTNSDDAIAMTSSSSNKSALSVRPNPLTKFSSHNYVIKIQATDNKGANDLFSRKQYDTTNQKWYTIINSAGGSKEIFKETLSRKWFSNECYVDDVTFKSVVGANNISKATIVCELEFQITEPYGINFLRELWDFNTNQLKAQNYLETCYMMSIEWKGYLDDGSFLALNSKEQIKYIPFRISNIEIQLSPTGAVYSVKAIPYNTISGTQMFGYIPTSITAKGQTLKEIIKDSFEPSLNESLQKSAEENYRPTETSPRPSPSIEYKFNFVEKKIDGKPVNIGDYKLSEAKDINNINISLEKLDDKNIEAEIAKNMQSFKILNRTIPSGQSVTFNGKEQIVEALTQMVIMSEYVTSQIRSFKQAYNQIILQELSKKTPLKDIQSLLINSKELNKPIQWFKILPKVVEIKKWNEYTNMYDKVVQYDIVPYLIYDSRNANNIISGSKPSEDQVVKEYFYFFTGQNTEVLNCDIKFNSIYFNYMQSNTNKLNQASGTKPVNANKDPGTYPQDRAATSDVLGAGSVSGTPSQPTRPITNVGKPTAERSHAAQFSSSLYSSVDLVTVSLEIMGDPDLILQDSILYDTTDMESRQDNPDYKGSVTLTNEERFMRLKFVSPSDIDLDTGIIKKENKSIFDGIYRMNIVNSAFKQGKFTQTLELMKVAMVDPSIPEEQRLDFPEPPDMSIPFDNSIFEKTANLFGLGDLSNLPGPPGA